MVLFPNCKINIGLNIVSRRPDGYHNIESVMVPVDWCDILEIVPGEAAGEDRLFASGRVVDCPPERNLVMRAVKAMREHYEFGPVDIYLEKILPDGAGLGGGSADASFTLKGLNNLFELGCTEDKLCEIASGIGADCPFFINNSPAFVHGIGTDMDQINLNLDGYNIVIVKPPVGVSTARAYAGVAPTEPATSLLEDIKKPVSCWRDYIKNDFEPSVGKQLPVIDAIKNTLYCAGAEYAAMSGSGSALFALFKADKMSPEIGRLFPRCITHICKAVK